VALETTSVDHELSPTGLSEWDVFCNLGITDLCTVPGKLLHANYNLHT
jgi:hypothetical protein